MAVIRRAMCVLGINLLADGAHVKVALLIEYKIIEKLIVNV